MYSLFLIFINLQFILYPWLNYQFLLNETSHFIRTKNDPGAQKVHMGLINESWKKSEPPKIQNANHHGRS